MPFQYKKRTGMAFFAVVMTAIFLAACGAGDPTPATEPTKTEPTAQPTATPTPTPKPYGDFASALVPPTDPEQLARLTNLLSLVPASFSSAVYLDLELLRSNASLATFISPEVLGVDVALPSFATGLVNTIAVAADLQARNVITPFHGDFPIADMLRLASGFGLQLSEGGPQSYEGHDVWDINALGTVLAMAAADETTGVAATGTDARALTEESLDAFDGRSARLLDAPGLLDMMGNTPSGFAAMVLSQCENLPLLGDSFELPGCVSAVVTVSTLAGDLVVFHALIGFTDQDQATSAWERANESLENQKRSHGFEDLGVRPQGDDNLRVRVIADLSRFSEVLRLFTPSR